MSNRLCRGAGLHVSVSGAGGPVLPPSLFLGDPSLEVFNVTSLPFLVRLSDHNTTHVIRCFGRLRYYMYIYNMPKVPN